MTWSVVIVDDNPEMRDLISHLLAEDPGFDVVDEAGNGDEALPIIDMRQPDVVILDLEMPGRDGMSILAEISSRPVVMISALDTPATRKKAAAAGASGFLGKNADFPAQLVPYLRALLSARAETEARGGAGTGPETTAAIIDLRIPTPKR